MLNLNQEQMEWVKRKAENPAKRLLKNYFLQFEGAALREWCCTNNISVKDVPASYIKHATHIKTTKTPSESDILLKYPSEAESIKYHHRAAGWIIYLDLVVVTEKTEWDDEMVSKDIRSAMSQMMKSVEIIIDLLKLQFPDLLGSLTTDMDYKTLTLKLCDNKFPTVDFKCRIGFIIEKIYM
jgi:hypothetical protein